MDSPLREMCIENRKNGLPQSLTSILEEMNRDQGESFDPEKVNLAELERRTGITRSRLRRLKKQGFVCKPHGNTGKHRPRILDGYTGILDCLLQSGVSNAEVCFERLQEAGYKGGLTTVKTYLASHRDLLPPKRRLGLPQGNRGRRYSTGPGDCYQMDWGFVNVINQQGDRSRIACFVMVCHHCGSIFIEFFPNARQESLFIGIIHAFGKLGIPHRVLTDNMKSVVISRDSNGSPIWQNDYAAFMKTIGFETSLCKPRHPFTKGAVERTVGFVKSNFLAGRTFTNLTRLNEEAALWCDRNNSEYHRSHDGIPGERHSAECAKATGALALTADVRRYLCPLRRISFDGFVSFEGRRFGVPYWYQGQDCRVLRQGHELIVYAADMSRELAKFNVNWGVKDQFCADQYVEDVPEEHPTAQVRTSLRKIPEPMESDPFQQFNFAPGQQTHNDSHTGGSI